MKTYHQILPGLLFFLSAFVVTDFVNAASICDRSDPVRYGIEEALKKPCASITDKDLATIKKLEVTCDQPGRVCKSALKANDLAGLQSLEELDIIDQDGNDAFIEIPAGFLQNTPGIKQLQLRLGSNKLKPFRDDILKGLTKLERMQLAQIELDTLPEAMFADAKNLKELAFTLAKIEDVPLGLLRGLTKLEELHLEWAHVYIRTPMLAGLTSLKSFRADGGIVSIGKNLLQDQKKLQELTLTDCSIRRIPKGAFRNQKELRTLDLGANQITYVEKGAFDDLKNMELISLLGNPNDKGTQEYLAKKFGEAARF